MTTTGETPTGGPDGPVTAASDEAAQAAAERAEAQGLLFADEVTAHPRRHRLPRANRLRRRRDHLPPARLLGAHRIGGARDPGGERFGTQRLYSFRDVLVLKIVKRLLDTGVSLQQIRVAVQHLRDRGIDDLAQITLMSDGASVYECTSADEVIDLVQGGQGVFGIAVGRVWREIEGTLANCPAKSRERQSATSILPTPQETNSRPDAAPVPLADPQSRVTRQHQVIWQGCRPRRERPTQPALAPKEQSLPGNSQATGPHGRGTSGKQGSGPTDGASSNHCRWRATYCHRGGLPRTSQVSMTEGEYPCCG